MGRQRRGVVGCTNLPALTHHCEAHAGARHLPRQPLPPGDTQVATTRAVTKDANTPRRAAADNGAMDRRRRRKETKRREKFKLPLISSASGTDTLAGDCRPKRKLSPREPQLSEHEQAEHLLSASIEAHECASKSFKHEHWYTSPIGFGSKKSVLLSALKARDPGGSGIITCKQLINALQATNFGLNESQARSLLTDFDAELKVDDAKVPYRSFVNYLRLPDKLSNQPGQDPTIFYQQSYVHRVRAHAAHLIETVAAMKVASTDSNTPVTDERPHGSREQDIVLPPVLTSKPSRDAQATRNNDVDRLSFEFDKVRKQHRAEAKSRILLAHINRIDAFSRHQQQVAEQNETMRLAAKALHRHAHFEHAFEEENRRLRIAQRDSKGLLGSPISQIHHNVSKDSMFFVEPV